MRKCFKKYIRKIGNKNDNDVAADVAQQEHSNKDLGIWFNKVSFGK